MRLEDEIFIAAHAEKAFRFFENMQQNYVNWHPDHRMFLWTHGKGLRVGNKFYFEEVIGGKLLKKKVVLTRVQENEYIEFAPANWLYRLIMPKLVFAFEPHQSGFVFKGQIIIRTGPLGAWLNRKEFDAVRKHMKEEGENLKSILEAD